MKCLTADSDTLSDEALASEASRLAREERRATAQLVAVLAEFDARRLYLPAGCASMFTYCTQVLRLSEHAAYNRIEAARVARRYPRILQHLDSGEITLTAVRLLAPCLTATNYEAVLQSARHKTKREVEHLVAGLRPQADVRPMVRKLPTIARTDAALSNGLSSDANDRHRENNPGPDVANPDVASQPRPLSANQLVAPPAPLPRAIVAPLAPERWETYDKLLRAQELLRHAVPCSDVAEIVDRALTLLVAELERRKAAVVKRSCKVTQDCQKLGGTSHNASPGELPSAPGRWPRSGLSAAGQVDVRQPPGVTKPSRRIPATVRRQVWARDEGRCAYVGTAGRCTERALLEFHHVVPYADGGEATVRNIELRCRRHNRFEAERWSGADTLPAVVREIPPS